jgi:hypothetical protein
VEAGTSKARARTLLSSSVIAGAGKRIKKTRLPASLFLDAFSGRRELGTFGTNANNNASNHTFNR